MFRLLFILAACLTLAVACASPDPQPAPMAPEQRSAEPQTTAPPPPENTLQQAILQQQEQSESRSQANPPHEAPTPTLRTTNTPLRNYGGILPSPLSDCNDFTAEAVAARAQDASDSNSTISDAPMLLNVVDINFDGATAHFAGTLTDFTVDCFLDAVRDHGQEITHLQINSPGGDTRSGRELGKWVFDNRITLIVDEFCFSSCANYIFTAAPEKIIRPDAIVGWHGGEQQARFIAASRGIELDQYYDEVVTAVIAIEEERAGRQFSDDERQAMHDQMKRLSFGSTAQLSIRREQEFLERIGITVDPLVWGLMPERYHEYEDSELQGWTFTLEAMNAQGIENVRYEGETPYPSPLALERYPLLVYETPDP